MPRFSTAVRGEFPDFAGDCDEVEDEAARWAGRFRDAKSSVRRGFERASENRQNNVEFLVAIPAVGIATRVQQLVDALVSLVNKNNPHAAPPVARALFEVCCIPIYLRRELVPRLRKGRVNAVHIIVFKLGLGGTGALGGEHIKPIAVDALISSARAELKAMEEQVPPSERINAHELIDNYYGPLTDLTHPNWPALSLGTKLGMPPMFSNPAEMDPSLMHDVVTSSAYALQRGGRAFDDVLTALAASPFDLPHGDPDWPEDHKKK